MITRSQMRRQLRAKGGIMNAVPRQKYGIGDFVRKLIPNELADIAVKAAPFVAPFNPGIAAAMRGIGRYDQRGDFKDALKQGALTYGFGKGIGKLGGASGSEMGNIFGRQKYSMEGFKDRGLGRLFQEKDTVLTKDQMNKKRLADLKNADSVKNTPEFMKKATEATIGKVPGLNKLPSMVQQKLLVGSITSGASALYSYFTGAFEPQQPGESMEEYMARRKTRVKQQMRGYMDSYYTPLRNPQYAAMSDEEKNNYIDSIVGQDMATGGRVGYQTGGISMTNTAEQNRAINNAQRASNIASRQNALARFRDHAITSNIMKGVTGKNTIPEYGLQTGADFQMKFPGVNPKVSSGLAAAYQTLQEGSRAILDGPGGVTLKDAYNTAVDQTGKNIEGILAADTGTLTAEQLKNRNEYLPIDQQTKTMTAATPTPDAGLSQAGVIPGFTKLKNPNGAPGNYNEFMYKGPDGQIYGTQTYSSIAAGQYPDMYDPNQKEYQTPNSPTAKIIQPTLPVEPMTGQNIMEGYAKYKEQNPGAGMGPGLQIMINGVLPDGTPLTFNNSAQAAAFNQYLESIGQAPFEKTQNPVDIAKIGFPNEDLRKITSDGSGLAKLAGGGMPMGEPRVNQGGITELDYRAKGGFVPVGIKEKADDVPAMLSKNEFVFTADAVRGAGNGSIENGAQKMYDTMKNLERRVT